VKYLLDTNVVSELRRRTPNENVLTWFDRTDSSTLYLSVLTLGEIRKGVEIVTRRDPATGRSLQHWLDGLRQHFRDRLVDIDTDVAEAWGRLAAIRPLPIVDALLAATASVHGMTVVTRNMRDIADIGVDAIDPWQS
jgi:toxin FitB